MLQPWEVKQPLGGGLNRPRIGHLAVDSSFHRELSGMPLSNKMTLYFQASVGCLMLAMVQLASAVSDKVDMTLGCKSNPRLVGSCFSVRGRLSTYNGNPSLRIWPSGTHQLLGVIEDEEPLSIPANIRNLVGFERDVWGTFLVCPFSKGETGHMQFVCVDEASNIQVRDRR